MYLHVHLVNDTVETSDLLSLLGVGLLKIAQPLVYLAQNNNYVSTVACDFLVQRYAFISTWQNHDLHPLTQTFDLRGMQKRISWQIIC